MHTAHYWHAVSWKTHVPNSVMRIWIPGSACFVGVSRGSGRTVFGKRLIIVLWRTLREDLGCWSKAPVIRFSSQSSPGLALYLMTLKTSTPACHQATVQRYQPLAPCRKVMVLGRKVMASCREFMAPCRHWCLIFDDAVNTASSCRSRVSVTRAVQTSMSLACGI